MNKPVLIILNGLQTLTKPVVGPDAPAARRKVNRLQAPGVYGAAWRKKKQALVTGTSWSRASGNRRTTSRLWRRLGPADRRWTALRLWPTSAPAVGCMLASTAGRLRCGPASLAPRWATGPPLRRADAVAAGAVRRESINLHDVWHKFAIVLLTRSTSDRRFGKGLAMKQQIRNKVYARCGMGSARKA